MQDVMKMCVGAIEQSMGLLMREMLLCVMQEACCQVFESSVPSESIHLPSWMRQWLVSICENVPFS
jgi:hypothetical protein